MRSKRPRLVFFDCVTHYGGAQRSTVHLLSKLNAMFDVRVVDPYGVCQAYLEALAQASVPVTILPCQPRSHFIGGTGVIRRGLSCLRQLPEWTAIQGAIKQEMKRCQPDAVLTNSYKAMALLWLSGVTATYPVAYYARGWYQKHQVPWLGRWLIKQATCVLAVSNATAESLRQWPIPPERIHVCHTVIDMESVITEAKSPCTGARLEADGAYKILIPAQLLAAKGQRVAVEAAVELKRRGVAFVMWLAGDVKMGVDSQFVEALHETIERHGLQDQVVCLGHRSDVRTLMSRANVVVLPSLTEGFPRAIWEAMLLQCPVIATPAGGVTDLVEHDKTGLLVPFDDAPALAAAIERLVHETDLATRLAQAAFDKVTQTYSEPVTLTKVGETLLSVCER
ncbi:MAG: glycosyltransferase [Phycisphaerae bacterium]|nr:glycosyltransferase [Phycisphaerae bacterium]